MKYRIKYKKLGNRREDEKQINDSRLLVDFITTLQGKAAVTEISEFRWVSVQSREALEFMRRAIKRKPN